jgi:hypothetical protein
MDNPVELGMAPEEMEAEARLSEMRVETLAAVDHGTIWKSHVSPT